MDPLRGLAGHELGRSEYGELQSVGVEPMDRVQAEEGGKAFIAGVGENSPAG